MSEAIWQAQQSTPNDFAVLKAHIQAIDQCNQRGGRMLSLVDLIAAGTVDLELAAYLAAMMRQGSSLLVGAQPGGAGKTAVMCALLNFLPNTTTILPVTRAVLAGDGQQEDQQVCYLAHEIGDGPYFAYVWGESARRFFLLAGVHNLIASNLHADTLGEMRTQLCAVNRVGRSLVDQVPLKIFLRVARGEDWSIQRWVSHVYESDGIEDRLVWRGRAVSTFEQTAESGRILPESLATYRVLLGSLIVNRTKTIEEVRSILLSQKN